MYGQQKQSELQQHSVLSVDEPERILLLTGVQSKKLVKDVRCIVHMHAAVAKFREANCAPCRFWLSEAHGWKCTSSTLRIDSIDT
jgi:hypothetical protein